MATSCSSVDQGRRRDSEAEVNAKVWPISQLLQHRHYINNPDSWCDRLISIVRRRLPSLWSATRIEDLALRTSKQVAMTYKADLTGTGPIRPVGYLARKHPFTKGRTSWAFIDCLVALVKQPLLGSLGYHNCDLAWCGLTIGRFGATKFLHKGRVISLGHTEIVVPGDGVVYQAPSLILHYIRWHRYLPPPCFIQAVLNCPEPGSQEYFAALKRIVPERADWL